MFRRLDTRSMCADILDAAKKLGLFPKTWSFCELQLGEPELAALRRWAWQLTLDDVVLDDMPTTVAGFTVPRAAALGLVFALFSAEIGRRDATEGLIWPVIDSEHFRPEVRTQIFTDGQPVPLMRKAMETAFCTFNLRHVFGTAGLQSWMDSIYLQFGISRHGLRRLPWWLDGAEVPQAVQRLREKGRNRSESFLQTWKVLQAVRRHEMNPDDARNVLLCSPWILEAHVHEAIENALRLPDGTGEALQPTLFSLPRLQWSESKPAFVVQALGADLFDLTEDAYDVCLQGRALTRLLRQADGRYIPLGEITLPPDAPELTLSLVTRGGETAVSETVELWPLNDEVVLYRLRDGRRVKDAWNEAVSPTLDYALLLTHDLEIVPQAPREWVPAGGGGWRLYRIAAPLELEVHLDGGFFWAPEGPATEPPWAADVQVTWMRDGDDVRLEVWHPPDVTVERVRVNRQAPALMRRNHETTDTGRVEVRGAFLCHRLDTRTFLSHAGETCRVRRVSSLDLVRMLRRHQGDVVEVDPSASLFIEDMGQMRIYPPRNWAGTEVSQWCLLEGDTWVSRPTASWGPLRGLRGWGAPLKLRTRPYNAREPDLVLIEEVRWSGCVRSVRTTSNKIAVDLRHEVAVSDRHRLVVWTEDGEILDASPASDWSLPLRAAPVGAAVAYEGKVLGSWFRDDWSEQLRKLAATDVEEALWLISWMRPPLLSGRFARTVARIARENAAAFLDTWSAPDVDDADLVVPRAYFERWKPSPAEAREVLTTLGATKGAAEALFRLLRLHPVPTARIMKAAELRGGDLCLELTGASTMDAAVRLNENLGQMTASVMGARIDYVNRLAKSMAKDNVRLGSLDHRDTRMALSVESFRRFVLSSYLLMSSRMMSPAR